MLTRARAGGWRYHSDVIIVRDETGWQGAGDVTHRKRAEVCVRIWRKWESSTRHQTRRIDFWSSQARDELAPYEGRTRWGPNESDSIEDCVSPPYVETFNSKLIKRFRTRTRSRYVFSNSEIPMFFICSIVINIRCPFHPFCTWPYSCIWLWNSFSLLSWHIFYTKFHFYILTIYSHSLF